MNRLPRHFIPRLAVGLIAGILCTLAAAPVSAATRAKNVIVLIADGCSSEQYTFARWFKGSALSFDALLVGGIKTYMADSVVTDSAAAASAFATGVRTSDKSISMGPHEKTITGVTLPSADLRHRPLATVLEGARLLGKATGIVATSRVTHATPAAYIAHVPSRKMEDDIMEQAVYQLIDVAFGGGKRLLLPDRRYDGENLYDMLKQQGYQIVESRNAMLAVMRGKVFGMFSRSHLDAEIDRPQQHPEQPTLAEMTRKAIEILSQDPDGFFLMVEGSQIDWACHANDPAHLLSDMLAYDRAVEAALDFAKQDHRTLVLAFSDHNTGGFSIGNYATSKSYSQMTTETLLEPFRKMKVSSQTLWKMVGADDTPLKIRQVIQEGWGIDIDDADARKILELARLYPENPHYGIGEVISAKFTVIGWTTHGHSGGDVPLHAFGPGRPVGLLDGPDIGKACAAAMGLNLDRLNQRLFVEAGKVFGEHQVSLDKTDPNNPVARIRFGDKLAALPVNKNILMIDDRLITLEGVVVYAPDTNKVYLPLQGVHAIKGLDEELPSVRLNSSSAKN